MKRLVFLDSNVFIWAYNRPDSNSAKILELMNEGEITVVISEKVIEELRAYFTAHFNWDVWHAVFEHVTALAKVVLREEIAEELPKLKNKINEKDLEHIASVKALGIKYLVSHDRDFKVFPEHRTPKQFVRELGLHAAETEY